MVCDPNKQWMSKGWGSIHVDMFFVQKSMNIINLQSKLWFNLRTEPHSHIYSIWILCIQPYIITYYVHVFQCNKTANSTWLSWTYGVEIEHNQSLSNRNNPHTLQVAPLRYAVVSADIILIVCLCWLLCWLPWLENASTTRHCNRSKGKRINAERITGFRRKNT